MPAPADVEGLDAGFSMLMPNSENTLYCSSSKHRPLRPTLDVPILVLLRGELLLHLKPQNRKKLARRLNHAVTSAHEEHWDRTLRCGRLRRPGREESAGDHPRAEEARLPGRARTLRTGTAAVVLGAHSAWLAAHLLADLCADDPANALKMLLHVWGQLAHRRDPQAAEPGWATAVVAAQEAPRR